MMKQDLTKEEITWRFDVLCKHLYASLEEKADEYEKEEDAEFKDMQIRDQICASLLYLHKVDAVNIYINPNRNNIEDVCFTCNKKECIENADAIDEEDVWLENPTGKEIHIPIMFSEDEDDDAIIAVSFEFPKHELGNFCSEVIHLLREWCENDIDVINMIVFMESYFERDTDLYSICIWKIYYGLFIVDFWETRQQIPWEVLEIIERILRNRDGESGDVYDPFMRTGINLFSADGKYYADAEDAMHYYSIRIIRGILGEDWENVKYNDCLKEWRMSDCDTIIATPELNKVVEVSKDKTVYVGEWLLKKMLSCFEDKDRQALLVLPSNVLYSGGEYEKLRHLLSERNLLDVVVTLPTNIFPGTGVATSIILLSNRRDEKEDIWMIDLISAPMKHEDEEDDDSRMIVDEEFALSVINEQIQGFFKVASPEDVRQNECNWYAPSYVEAENDVPVGFKKVKINDLLEEIDEFGIFPLLDYTIIEEEDLKSDPYVPNVLDKKKSHEEFQHNTEEISKIQHAIALAHSGETVDWSLSENQTDYSYYSKSDVIAIAYDGKLKTAWYSHKPMSSLRIDDNLGCYYYKVNKDEINNDYLRLLLAEAEQEVWNNLASGDTYSLDDVLKTEVVIPMSVDAQKKLYEQKRLNHLIEKARKEGLDVAINRMKEEYINEVRMRKHDMKPFISQLDSLTKMMLFYLDRIDGNEDIVDAIREDVESMANAVNELRLHLNRLTEEEIYGNPEVVNLVEAMEAHAGDYGNYSVCVNVDELAIRDSGVEIPFVYISPVDLSTLVNTIKENAIAHAFINSNENYMFQINIGVNKENGCFIIDFRNNGKPMPLGMDKYRYGLRGEKGARSKGSGLGGYRVKSISRHYGGDYDVFCSRNVKFGSTTIRVELPIYKDKV